MKVLYIEDDLIDRLLFSRFAEKAEGVQHLVVESLTQAEEIVQKETFDIIVTDYHLGFDTAFDVMEKLAGNSFFVLSGLGEDDLTNE